MSTLVDTSAWIDFFRGREPIAARVDTLIAENRASICGMIELEIRQGLRQQEGPLLETLQAVHYLKTVEDDFSTSGDLLAALRRRSVSIPATDGLIAQVALRNGAPLLANDKHFSYIPKLMLAE